MTREEFLRLAAAGYNRIPMACETLADFDTPLSIYLKLADELAKAKDELFKLRFQSATGQLETPGRLRSVKKDIARIYTILRERELGIRQAPGAAE